MWIRACLKLMNVCLCRTIADLSLVCLVFTFFEFCSLIICLSFQTEEIFCSVASYKLELAHDRKVENIMRKKTLTSAVCECTNVRNRCNSRWGECGLSECLAAAAAGFFLFCWNRGHPTWEPLWGPAQHEVHTFTENQPSLLLAS